MGTLDRQSAAPFGLASCRQVTLVVRSTKMKKIAIIVVGEHYAGKSKTINKHLKSMLSLDEKQHKFGIGNCGGFILSQTLEERNASIGNLERYKIF